MLSDNASGFTCPGKIRSMTSAPCPITGRTAACDRSSLSLSCCSDRPGARCARSGHRQSESSETKLCRSSRGAVVRIQPGRRHHLTESASDMRGISWCADLRREHQVVVLPSAASSLLPLRPALRRQDRGRLWSHHRARRSHSCFVQPGRPGQTPRLLQAHNRVRRAAGRAAREEPKPVGIKDIRG